MDFLSSVEDGGGMTKQTIGRPGVIQLVMSKGKQKWSKSRKPVIVESSNLSVEGGDIVSDGVHYRAAALPGYPGDGTWRFTEHRGAGVITPTEDRDEDGLNPEEAAMLQDIIAHGRKDQRLVDAMTEFLWLQVRDPKKAHRFYKALQAGGWYPPDRDSLSHIKERRRQLETEDWRTPEELAAWEVKHAEDLRELALLPRLTKDSTGDCLDSFVI